jgi:hypothetical protein
MVIVFTKSKRNNHMPNPATGYFRSSFLQDAFNDARVVRQVALLRANKARWAEKPLIGKCSYCGTRYFFGPLNCRSCGAPIK